MSRITRSVLATVLVTLVHPRLAVAQPDPAPAAPGATTAPEEAPSEEETAPLESGAEDVIEVEAEVERDSVVAQTLERRASSASQDAVGRAEIAKTPDKNAAEAARRVVGTSIVGGRFVFVRGLGERYTNALLDGAPLPSPEPDRQAVPLDLFPTSTIDSITIVKTFTPDVPGDFAGGSVRIATRRLPDEPVLSLSLGAGFNTNATFAARPDHEGGGLDWLGFDDGTRALPEEVPDHAVVRGAERPDGGVLGREETTRIGRALNSDLRAMRSTSPPNHSMTAVAGKTFEIGEQRLGAMASLTYNRSYERRTGEIVRTFNQPGGEGEGLGAPRNDLAFERGVERVAWGGLAGLSWEPDDDHHIHLTGLYSRAADDETRDIEGLHNERGARIHETRLSFVQRALAFVQLRGEHTSTATWGTEIDWNASVGRAVRDEPDTRGAVYQLDSAFGYVLEDDAQSGLHFFSEQGETSFGGGLDVRQPLAKKETPTDAFAVKVGGRFDVRDRTFAARRFRFRPISGVDPAELVCPVQTWDEGCPSGQFEDADVGRSIEIEENTRDTDGYDADSGVYAAYFMVDGPLLDRVRIVLGQRLEISDQSITSFNPSNPAAERQASSLTAQELLPAAALVVTPTDEIAVRVSGSRTVARPQLRELAPFSFNDYFGGRETQGNPELDVTRITNVDARFEWFPSLREVVAASVFLKVFDAPIEATVDDSGSRGVITYQNADGATLGGVELEARKNLAFLAEGLTPLTLVANVTLARSRVTLEESSSSIVTNASRPLSQQSPWVINAAVDFEEPEWGTSARLSYNVAGPRIVQVGTRGLDDVYEQPRHTLDLAIAQRFLGDHLELKGTLQNIVDDDFTWTIGEANEEEAVVGRYALGQTFGLSATLSL